MRIPSKERINALRETYKGKRIKLIEMDDPLRTRAARERRGERE